jgi:hypothetical protein
MQYPEILLPQTHFKCIVSELAEHHICRTSPTKDYINPLTNRIKDEELCERASDFFDYSTNHLGQFELDHNYFGLTGEERKYFRSYWDFINEVKKPKFEQDFVFDNSRGIFFFRIGDIHKSIHFPITNSKQKADKLTAIVKHTPSNSNFWHFSIRWVDKDGAEVSPNESKWKNPIIATIRAKLQEVFIQPTPPSRLIPDTDYTKIE